MRCDYCKREVCHLTYTRNYAFCRSCILIILLSYGTYLGKGKFLVEKFIIKYAKAGGN